MTEQQNAYQRVTMDAKEAAAWVGVSYWLILELAKKKEIPAIRAGGRVLFRAESLSKWMDQQEAKSMGQEQPERGKLRVVGK